MRSEEDIRKEYIRRQRQGKQDLRFLSLLLFLGLLLYSVLNFYILFRINGDMGEILLSYALYAGGTLLVWCIPLRMLWKYNRLGRIVYWLCLVFCAYLYKDTMQLFYVTWEPVPLRYSFIVLFVLKCAMMIYGGLRIVTSSDIRAIWNVDDLFDEELAALEAVDESGEGELNQRSKRSEKAILLLKRSSIRLGLVLYISSILIYILLGMLGSHLPDYSEGIHVIQYMLFSECLFSVMIWSIPMIAMFMGKLWSPYLIYVAMGTEFIRLGLSYVQYVELVINKAVASEVKILFVVLEIMRYLLLYASCRNALSHPLLKVYRMKNKKNNE